MFEIRKNLDLRKILGVTKIFLKSRFHCIGEVLGLDDNDDRGRPPYPLLKDLQGSELDYLTCWLDHYTLDQNDSHRPNIIGYLKEFKEQQNTNLTTFILPPILV